MKRIRKRKHKKLPVPPCVDNTIPENIESLTEDPPSSGTDEIMLPVLFRADIAQSIAIVDPSLDFTSNTALQSANQLDDCEAQDIAVLNDQSDLLTQLTETGSFSTASLYPESREVYLGTLGRVTRIEKANDGMLSTGEKREYEMAKWFIKRRPAYRPDWGQGQ